MLRLLNVATPATAATLVVPESVPPPGFAAIAIVTVLVNVVTVLPTESRAATCTAGERIVAAVVVTGWDVNTRAMTGPGLIVNVLLVAPASPLEAAVRV